MEINPKSSSNSPSDSDKFYEELDKTKVHQSCCTCQTLAILFLTILIILAGTIFYIYYQVTREKVFSFKIPSISLDNFNKKLSNLKTAQADQSGQIQITLTDEDLSALLSEGLSLQSFLLKDIQVQILPTEILIYGRLVKPLKSKVVISALPSSKDGKINFEVTGVTAGNFNFPKFINAEIGKSLTNLVNAKLEPIYTKFEVQETNLEENKLIINGKAK